MSKAIVLLCDGTGNSYEKLEITNIVRILSAVDTEDPTDKRFPRQFTIYNDGVGTSNFKPSAMLGSIFGIGLKSIVLKLYTALCSIYQPHDRIYAFGFSRGAFAMRILIDIVCRYGMVKMESIDDIEYYFKHIYSDYWKPATDWKPTVVFYDILYQITGRRMSQISIQEIFIEVDCITFLGLWDTVGAYGLPVHELNRGLDKWIFPVQLPNASLHPKIRKACHALALDDDRDTFHPILWDEISEQELVAAGICSPDRLSQVWFAGAHADVGGGYLADSMAYASLNWMINNAEIEGLRFRADMRNLFRANATATAPMHHPRDGILRSYYRYLPRNLNAYIHPPADPTTVFIQNPELEGRGLLKDVNVHASVQDRIEVAHSGYSPIGLPMSYNIVGYDNIVYNNDEWPPGKEIESSDRSGHREEIQKTVWEYVWRRRVIYACKMLATMMLILLPIFDDTSLNHACIDVQCLITPTFKSVDEVTPDILQPWSGSYARNPGIVILCAIGLLVLAHRDRVLRKMIARDMEAAWRPSTSSPRAVRKSIIYKLRSNILYQRLMQYVRWTVLPLHFGFFLFGAIIYVGVALSYILIGRVFVAQAERTNFFCTSVNEQVVNQVSQAPERFLTNTACWPTRWHLKQGGRYRISLTITQPWQNGESPANPIGFGAETAIAPLAADLARRSLSSRWFQPLLKIVPPAPGVSSSIQALDMRPGEVRQPVYIAEFVADQSGEAFLFVNDAVTSWLGATKFYYANNRGEADVRIEQIDWLGRGLNGPDFTSEQP